MKLQGVMKEAGTCRVTVRTCKTGKENISATCLSGCLGNEVIVLNRSCFFHSAPRMTPGVADFISLCGSPLTESNHV